MTPAIAPTLPDHPPARRLYCSVRQTMQAAGQARSVSHSVASDCACLYETGSAKQRRRLRHQMPSYPWADIERPPPDRTFGPLPPEILKLLYPEAP